MSFPYRVPDTTRFTAADLFRRPAEPDPGEVLCVDLSGVPVERREIVAAAIRDLVARHGAPAIGSSPLPRPEDVRR